MNNIKMQSGVTLIELMIVVVIIGILSSIAMYGFGGVSQKARRADATTALLRVAENQEKSYIVNTTYTDVMSKIGGASTDMGYYVISSAIAGGGSSYTLIATAVTGGAQQNDPVCSVVKLTSAGQKTPADCW